MAEQSTGKVMQTFVILFLLVLFGAIVLAGMDRISSDILVVVNSPWGNYTFSDGEGPQKLPPGLSIAFYAEGQNYAGSENTRFVSQQIVRIDLLWLGRIKNLAPNFFGHDQA